MKRIVVGTIVKPQGIRGEVKVLCYVDAPAGLTTIKQVYVAGTPYRVLLCRTKGNEAYLSLEGVSDRNAAELLRGSEVAVDRAVADHLKKGDYFISDLVGLQVVDTQGQNYGVLQEILQYGAADVFVIGGRDHQYMAPYLKRLVVAVDLQAGTLTVDPVVWREVSCEN